MLTVEPSHRASHVRLYSGPGCDTRGHRQPLKLKAHDASLAPYFPEPSRGFPTARERSWTPELRCKLEGASRRLMLAQATVHSQLDADVLDSVAELLLGLEAATLARVAAVIEEDREAQTVHARSERARQARRAASPKRGRWVFHTEMGQIWQSE